MAGNATLPSAPRALPGPRPAGSAAPAQGDAATPTDAMPAQASAARGKGPARADDPVDTRPEGSVFDALLAPATQGLSPAAAPTVAATEAPAPETARAAATPEQLLALLAGAWALPAAAVPATAVPATAPGSAPVAGSATTTTAPVVATAAGQTGAFDAPILPTLTLTAAGPASDVGAATVLGTLPSGAPETGLADAGTATSGSSDAASAFDGFLSGVGATAAPSPAREATPVSAPLPVPADPDAGFDDGFGARIAWMAEQRLGQAQIRLNPEHLGPIEVSLQLDGSRVDAQFHSTHVEVRAALEASVPRLRELLGQHGLQLGQADVGQRQSHGAPSGQSAARWPGAPDGSGDGANIAGTPAATVVHRRGLLDEYA